MIQEEEARSRLVFDEQGKTLDLSKKRVTDLKQNSHVHLPPPLNPVAEAGIAVRKAKFMEEHRRYARENCDKKNNQRLNLSFTQRKGLASLKKRIKEEELVVLQTDKTGKLVACSRDIYLKMGQEHTAKDREISWGEAEEVLKELKGHTSMWIKITGMGKTWNQVDRVRKSLITHAPQVPPLYLLVKDHKQVEPGAIPPTRPVVSGSRGMNLHLNDVLSEVLEPLSRCMPSITLEAISTEHTLNLVDELNNNLRRAEENEEEEVPNTESGGDEHEQEEEQAVGGADVRLKQDQPVLTAFDAKSLYPSLDTTKTAKVVREETMKANINLEGMSWREMARYLALTTDPWQQKAWNVAKYIPTRKNSKGGRPGIHGKEALGEEEDSQDQWVFKNLEPTNTEMKILLGACLCVGIQTVFRLHTYSFGGRLFQQVSGGPIGLRLTAIVAKIRVAVWLMEIRDTLNHNSIYVVLCFFYVDDIRLLTSPIPLGVRWDHQTGTFKYEDKWREEDKEMTTISRTSREILSLMNDKGGDMSFTMETE